MDDHRIKPGSPGDILNQLVHYGVKGMRWGVRKVEESGGRDVSGMIQDPKAAASANAMKKAYMAANEQQIREDSAKTPEEVEKNLDKNLTKFSNKFNDSSADESVVTKTTEKAASPKEVVEAKKDGGGLKAKWNKLTPDQKTLAIQVGIGAAVVGGLAIAGHRNRKAILAMAGRPIPAEVFNKNVSHSQVKTWGVSGYIQKSSWAREAFELPAGHTFHRLTTSAETGFRGSTYSLHSIEDFNRYVAGFRHEKGPAAAINHVTFSTTTPTKIPALHEVLGTLNRVMAEEKQVGHVSERDTLKAYKDMSGGSWSNSREVKLIKELKKKGFGALIDEMDAGVIGETPLVFFNREAATPKRVKPLSKADIDNAENKLIELLNRKV